MRTLSPVQAIQPAIDRTRELLTQRRSLPTFLKICLIAVLAGLGNSFNFRLGSFNRGSQPTHVPPQIAGVLAAIAAFAVVIALVLGLIGLVVFYIGNRCEFVLFDMVLMRRTQAGPAWRIFGGRTWRWLGAKLLVLLGFVLLLTLGSLPILIRFIHATRGGQPVQWTHMLSGLLGSAVLLLLLFLVFAVVFTLMHDFLLPAVALENAPVFASFGRLWALCRAEPGEITVYLLLRLGLGVLMGIAVGLAAVVVTLVLGLVLALLGGVLWLLLRHAGPGGLVVLFAGIAVEVLVLLLAILATYVAVAGAFLTFLQAWSLYFLGGRYTLLGDLLEPPLVYAQPATQGFIAPPSPPMPPPFAPPAPL